MQSAYSWMGSRLHLILEDDIADAYNRRMRQWFDAQKRHKERTGAQWDPLTEPLLMEVDNEAQKAHDDVAKVINLLIEINGGGLDIPEEECVSDFLVKL